MAHLSADLPAMSTASFYPPEKWTYMLNLWVKTVVALPHPSQPPKENYNSQQPLQMAGRCHYAPAQLRKLDCAVPANSRANPAWVEFCVSWRRLTLPSCPSCLSFITGGSFPTPSTIAGWTMAEVGNGSGWGGSVRRFWEGTLEWQYEVPSMFQALCRAPLCVALSPPHHCRGVNGPRVGCNDQSTPRTERQSLCSSHFVFELTFVAAFTCSDAVLIFSVPERRWRRWRGARESTGL